MFDRFLANLLDSTQWKIDKTQKQSPKGIL